MELVSVIMSVYNEDKITLEKSIKSIQQQTYNNIEIIIVNDNPNNKVNLAYIEDLSKNDKRIVLIQNKTNRGLVYSLNKALEYATGNYIARMDADDIAINTRLEEQVEYLTRNKLDIVGSRVNFIDENDNILETEDIRPLTCERIYRILKYRNCLAHPSWLVKREVYKELNGYRAIPYSEDYDFLIRARARGYKMENMDRKLLYYRQNSQGISASSGVKQFLVAQYLRDNINKIDSINERDVALYNMKEVEGEAVKQYLSEMNGYRNRLKIGKLSRYVIAIRLIARNKIARKVLKSKVLNSIYNR